MQHLRQRHERRNRRLLKLRQRRRRLSAWAFE
jgi:hypothetical protein